MGTNIRNHEGKKYLREIHAADIPQVCINVDVYSVIEAFGITCPAQAHALKKVLCAGQRGKGTKIDDLVGAIAALSRAIELQQQRETQNGRS